MSLSDTKAKKLQAGRTAIIYLCVSMFCGMFSAIYEHFSHGVYSDFMVYLFMFPLAGGALPFTAIGLINKLPFPTPAAKRSYNSGIASFTTGSCIKGILDIYGTSSGYTAVYWVAGVLLVCAGLSSYVCQIYSRVKN